MSRKILISAILLLSLASGLFAAGGCWPAAKTIQTVFIAPYADLGATQGAIVILTTDGKYYYHILNSTQGDKGIVALLLAAKTQTLPISLCTTGVFKNTSWEEFYFASF